MLTQKEIDAIVNASDCMINFAHMNHYMRDIYGIYIDFIEDDKR